MPDLYDDDDELMKLLDSGGEAPTVDLSTLSSPSIAAGGGVVDADELDALLGDAIAAKSGGPSMDIGEIQMTGKAPGSAAVEENAPSADWAPAGEETGLESLLEDKPAPVPAPKDTASIVMADDNGKQAILGVKDQRQDLTGDAKRVAELYGDDEPASSGPGRYESEFLQENKRPSNDEIRRMMTIGNVLASLTDAGGDAGYGKMAEFMMKQQQDFDAGRKSARAADSEVGEKNRRVDRATAEMLVLAGVSPEAAVKARMGDPIVQLVRSTGGLGVKLRNQDTQVLNKNVGETGDVWKTLTTEEGKNERQDKQLANNVEVAKTRKRGAGGGGGGQNTSLVSYYLQESRNVPKDVADAAATGQLDMSTLDPEMRSKVELGLTGFKSLDGKTRQQLVRGLESRIGGENDKAGLAAQVKQADPVMRTKIKRELAAYNVTLSAAIRGWNSLPPHIKQLVAKTGLEGTTAQLRQLGMTGDEQAKFSPIIALINENIKKTAGAAVSNSEWARKSAEIGLSGAFSPFNDPKVLTGWLKRAGDLYKADVAAIESEYPGLFGGQ